MLPIIAFASGSCVYNMFDYGVSNLLGVQTLEHGTNAWNYLSIRLRGGDPSHGNKSTGSTKLVMDDPHTVDHFYLFKDREINESLSNFSIWDATSLVELIALSCFKYITPNPVAVLTRMHCGLSSFSLGYTVFSKTGLTILKIIGIVPGILTGAAGVLFVPTLKFRFSHVDEKRFENDSQYVGFAWKTSYKVEAWRIGLLGSLLTGLNTGWIRRAADDPIRIVKGAAQLACAATMTTLFAATVISNPPLLAATAAGMLLA